LPPACGSAPLSRYQRRKIDTFEHSVAGGAVLAENEVGLPF
jgi:hypothetical protein